ncbi:rust resistance kinase Lr10-like [Hordeum vulgare subsp. vulgare]|uniref:Protein kinase domain-containing protein n=1 Tax=Hordeum vulgare subsp. vulgare TaxID=112509 RepID=A0A8I6X9V5_HORVV|nr:rust resistance kinase Lr10-like [Hordeum vulgare subsp. vulgare]
MSNLFAAAVMLSLLLKDGISIATAWEDEDFFRYCPPSWCHEHGPEIRFPFRLESSNKSCSAPSMYLSCSAKQDTILDHPQLGPCQVTSIDYLHQVIDITPLKDFLSPCPLQKIKSTRFAGGKIDDPTAVYFYNAGSIVSCSREFTPSIRSDLIVGPIPCLSNTSHLSYLVDSDVPMYVLKLDCKVVSDGVIPIHKTYNPSTGKLLDNSTFKVRAERILSFATTTVSWAVRLDQQGGAHYSSGGYECQRCEEHGQRCAFNSQRNDTFCIHNTHGLRIKVIAATSSVATLVVLLSMVATALYFSLRTRYNEEIHLKVEMFLRTYGTSKPTRYTFSEVKKIARRFKIKVGQGGFGSVYKGELPNGVPVAVKMLENSRGEGEEFINEVATVGLIHHANIVRLLGFCSEGTRRALIYEFMPNDSLEKYIFSHESNIFEDILVPDKMIDVALGIARGMEYLHQGCNQRILHFDIKPHNILLDFNFNPKISDFGLAKLCARDQSIVTLTAARGTMGYIAPELYSRNFGGVSYKSDVYSFGMLVLEMVSRRRNSDPSVGSQNDVYLPEWIYQKVSSGQDLVVTLDWAQEEQEKVRQLAIVGLWCIQWNPKNRPSMTKVVNMLTARLQNLQMPPKPFITSENYPVV